MAEGLGAPQALRVPRFSSAGRGEGAEVGGDRPGNVIRGAAAAPAAIDARGRTQKITWASGQCAISSKRGGRVFPRRETVAPCEDPVDSSARVRAWGRAQAPAHFRRTRDGRGGSRSRATDGARRGHGKFRSIQEDAGHWWRCCVRRRSLSWGRAACRSREGRGAPRRRGTRKVTFGPGGPVPSAPPRKIRGDCQRPGPRMAG